MILDKILKLVSLGADLIFMLLCLIVFLLNIVCAVQVYHDRQEAVRDAAFRKRFYEWDQYDYKGKSPLQYEFINGKFKLIKE